MDWTMSLLAAQERISNMEGSVARGLEERPHPVIGYFDMEFQLK